MKKKLAVGICWLCAAALALPVQAARAEEPVGGEETSLQAVGEENCLDSLWGWFNQFKTGFITVDGKTHYASRMGQYDRFAPGFVTVEGRLCHVEPDGIYIPAGGIFGGGRVGVLQCRRPVH